MPIVEVEETRTRTNDAGEGDVANQAKLSH